MTSAAICQTVGSTPEPVDTLAPDDARVIRQTV